MEDKKPLIKSIPIRLSIQNMVCTIIQNATKNPALGGRVKTHKTDSSVCASHRLPLCKMPFCERRSIILRKRNQRLLRKRMARCLMANPSSSNSSHPKNCLLSRCRRYAQILILEIFLSIPPVKIFACLDLESKF